MTIQIPSNRIQNPAGGVRKPTDQRRQSEQQAAIVTPTRAQLNHIPEPESLFTMIRSAVSALRRGIFWDRGTILNIVV